MFSNMRHLGKTPNWDQKKKRSGKVHAIRNWIRSQFNVTKAIFVVRHEIMERCKLFTDGANGLLNENMLYYGFKTSVQQF